jgi:plasmid stability protein
MATLVIKSFPEALHDKLKAVVAAHWRSVTQETTHLIEVALAGEEGQRGGAPRSKWAHRRLLPEYVDMVRTGAFTGRTDSSEIMSKDRDDR